MIAAMTIGIVVDDTVHFMSKYLRARREYDLNPFDAVRYSFETVGKAMWITSLALVSGFMVLTLSGFRMNADMGWMAAITIVFALLLDFLFLPTLLIKVDKKSKKLITNYKEVYDEMDSFETGFFPNVVPVPVDDKRES